MEEEGDAVQRLKRKGKMAKLHSYHQGNLGMEINVLKDRKEEIGNGRKDGSWKRKERVKGNGKMAKLHS